jgi:NAD(P)-dependent dehydrogenase (short-subunit alcohol dehydrogenase family)
MYELSEKVALVTGAGRGIGKATALRLAEEGAAVIVVDLVSETAESTAREIRELGATAVGVSADISNAVGVERVSSLALSEFGRVDILVNNAGISRYKSILDSTEQDWDQHMDIMAKGTFLMMRAFAGGMMDRRYGRIVNLGSYVAQFNCTTKYFGPYCAAKFGVVALTQVAAQEFAPYVTVNAVGPGDVATEMMQNEWRQEGERKDKSSDEVKEEYRRRLLLQEFEGPQDIAAAIVYLCSDQAKHVTGAHHIVSGGLPYKVME